MTHLASRRSAGASRGTQAYWHMGAVERGGTWSGKLGFGGMAEKSIAMDRDGDMNAHTGDHGKGETSMRHRLKWSMEEDLSNGGLSPNVNILSKKKSCTFAWGS